MRSCVYACIALVSCRAPVDKAAAPSAKPSAKLAIVLAAQPVERERGAIEDVPDGRVVIRTAASGAAVAAIDSIELPAGDTAALLARLEPLPDVAAGSATPTMRPPTPPPPRAGPVVPLALVAPSGAAVPDAPVRPPALARPLVTPDIQPTGEVAREGEVRVRFDEPMVAVAQLGTTAASPATLSPAVPGTWRWLDTRVLVFAPTAARLPQATEYVVTVAAGTTAVSGATLAAAVEQRFRTAPVAIDDVFPKVARSDSAIALELDQDVDVAALRPFVHVADARGRALAFDVIDVDRARATWAKNPSLAISRDTEKWLAHALVIAPRGAWPAGRVGIVLDKGAPSREGPLVAARASGEQLEIVPPFTARGVRCDDVDEPRLAGARCPAWGWLALELSNPIEPHAYRAQLVQIAGEPFQDHEANGTWVSMSAPEHAGRTYAIAIGDGLVDVYGQPYTGARRVTFATGPERFTPYVSAPSGLVVLDPRFAIPQWLVDAEAIASLRVELYTVEPRDYFAFQAFEQGQRATPPGKRVVDHAYAIGARTGAHARVDLRPALGASGTGHVIAIATATPARDRIAGNKRAVAWLEVTKLAVSTRIDGERASTFVNDITPDHLLEPIAGATTSLVIDKRTADVSATTDATGRATLDLPERTDTDEARGSALLVARHGDDSAFVEITGARRAQRASDARWYVTDDRFTYKPGEKVFVKGWLRWSTTGVDPDLALPKPGEAVAWSLADARGNRIGGGTATLSDRGGFDVAVELPSNANTGTAMFTLASRTVAFHHPIRIEEFRTPAYGVSLDDDVAFAGATPVVVGETIEMRAEAKYYAGGGLGGAEITWDATLEPASYRPPGWDRYTFAPDADHDRYRRGRRASASARATSVLSSASVASVSVAATALPDHQPAVLTVDATVADVDRMHIRATSRAILVHPSSYYVGVRRAPSDDAILEAIVTDIDGKPVPGVAIAIAIDGVLGSERWRDDAKVIDHQACAVTSAAAPVRCEWHRKDIDTAYTATARIVDAHGRANSALYAVPWWSRADATRDLAITADKPKYRVGDVAALDIHSAIVPATAIVTVARQGAISQQRVELAKESTRVSIPIAPSYIDDVHVIVDRFARKAKPRVATAPPLPEHETTQIDLAVDVESARLAMTVRSRRPLVGPGDEATFDVDVTHDDKPVANAEVALIVVDEAVLALASRSFVDPLAGFFRHVGDGTRAWSSLHAIEDAGGLTDQPPGVERYDLGRWGTIGTGSGYGYGAGAGGLTGGGIGGVGGFVAARKDLRPNAAFAPLLHTDARGRATLTVKMPENLTRWRVVALAADGVRYFGKAESAIVTRRELNVRVVAPRFLAQGDAAFVPVVVQNLGASPRTIDVAVRAANLRATGAQGRRVVVPAGQRAELRFALATERRGTAAIQAIAASGDRVDATTVELPVYEPATTEAFAAYGTVDDALPHFEQLDVPKELFRDVGGVEVELASTQLQALTDAYWYLHAYPYECAEQRSARMLATSAVYDILDAFAVPGRPTRAEIDAQAARDLAILARTQNTDGGWGYFRGTGTDPFVTMQVVEALAARKADTSTARAYVDKLAAKTLARIHADAIAPVARRSQRDAAAYDVALAAHALAVLGSPARAVALDVDARALGAYPIDAKARVLALVAGRPADAALRARLVGELLAATHETAAAATVTASYVPAERLLLVSSTKTNALALDALLREAPKQAVVVKLARGLLAQQKRGRWTTTQDNLVAVRALRRYFDIYEKDTPDFAAKAWLGGAGYAAHAFAGRTTERATARVGWTELAPGSSHDLAFQRDGAGRMYYRVGIVYAPAKTDLPALDAGFVVRRAYTAIDDPKDVARGADGRWHVKLGARVLVTVEAINTTARDTVAVVDPVPAGFEIVNAALASAERPVADAGSRWDFENLRDERAEAFALTLREGTHVFAYTARATTPGTFLAAPAKAEEMYAPETFGRSRGEVVIVE